MYKKKTSIALIIGLYILSPFLEPFAKLTVGVEFKYG